MLIEILEEVKSPDFLNLTLDPREKNSFSRLTEDKHEGDGTRSLYEFECTAKHWQGLPIGVDRLSELGSTQWLPILPSTVSQRLSLPRKFSLLP